MIPIRIQNEKWIIDKFKSQGKDFEVRVTSKTLIIVKGKQRYLKGGKASLKDLGKIREVRRFAANMADKVSAEINHIFYNNFRTVKVGDGGLMMEYDVNKAYFQIAYDMGIISESIYMDSMTDKMSKDVRLMLLGALATTRYSFIFKKGKLHNLEKENNAKTRHLFFAVAEKMGAVMNECFVNFKDVLFFWVDAIFVRTESFDVDSKFVSFFTERGFGIKTKKHIYRIEKLEHSKLIRMWEIEKTEDVVKFSEKIKIGKKKYDIKRDTRGAISHFLIEEITYKVIREKTFHNPKGKLISSTQNYNDFSKLIRKFEKDLKEK